MPHTITATSGWNNDGAPWKSVATSARRRIANAAMAMMPHSTRSNSVTNPAMPMTPATITVGS